MSLWDSLHLTSEANPNDTARRKIRKKNILVVSLSLLTLATLAWMATR